MNIISKLRHIAGYNFTVRFSLAMVYFLQWAIFVAITEKQFILLAKLWPIGKNNGEKKLKSKRIYPQIKCFKRVEFMFTIDTQVIKRLECRHPNDTQRSFCCAELYNWKGQANAKRAL